MTRTFVELSVFRKRWKELGFNDTDLGFLQNELVVNPTAGAVIKETGGLRKIRFAFNNQGKRGSVRVIYIDFESYKKIFLITAYAKNEKDDLSKAEQNELRKLVTALKHQLEQNQERGA